jgi:hypothetical protein
VTDRKSTPVNDGDLTDDERVLHDALDLPASVPRSDAAFRARVRADVHSLRRRRFALLVPVVGGACALAAIVSMRDEVAKAPNGVHVAAALDDDDVADSEALTEEEALRLAAVDAIATGDEDALVGDDFDDDSLLALGVILDARIARVSTR